MAKTELPVFRALNEWQRVAGHNDAQTAEMLQITRSKFSRFRNGLLPLPIQVQLRLERLTEITPAQCAEFYAACVKARSAGSKKNLTRLTVEAAA